MENFKKKAENFWYYHKSHVFICIFVAIVLVVEIVSAVRKVEPDVIVAYVGESSFDTQKVKPFTDELASFLGDVNGDNKEEVLFTDVTINGDPTQIYYSRQKLDVLFLSGENSLFLMEEKYAKSYASSGVNFVPFENAQEGLLNENGIYAIKVDMSEYGYTGDNLYCLVYDAEEDNEKWRKVLSAAKKCAEHIASQQ